MGTYHTPISEVHLMDCMDFMRQFPDGYFQLGIIDPPYGIGEDGGNTKGRALRKDGSFIPKVDKRNGAAIAVKPKEYKAGGWDNAAPDEEYFKELRRVTKNQIVWGANHFISKIPFDSPAWIVWNKLNGTSDFADCELAWTSFDTAVKKIDFMWSGFRQGASLKEGRTMQGNMKIREERIHPTQKPVPLYEFLLRNYARPGDKILDTHVGSGSSRIAAYKMGFDFWGCEIDPDYYRDSEKRFKEAIAMPLFDAVPMATQLTIC